MVGNIYNIAYFAHNRSLCASNIFSDHLYRRHDLSAVERDYARRNVFANFFHTQVTFPGAFLNIIYRKGGQRPPRILGT